MLLHYLTKVTQYGAFLDVLVVSRAIKTLLINDLKKKAIRKRVGSVDDQRELVAASLPGSR